MNLSGQPNTQFHHTKSSSLNVVCCPVARIVFHLLTWIVCMRKTLHAAHVQGAESPLSRYPLSGS